VTFGTVIGTSNHTGINGGHCCLATLRADSCRGTERGVQNLRTSGLTTAQFMRVALSAASKMGALSAGMFRALTGQTTLVGGADGSPELQENSLKLIIMKILNHWFALATLAATFCLTPGRLSAQDQRPARGNFDPEQMRQRMMERYREQLEVKGDDEWKLIQERIEKVVEARRQVGFGGGGGFGMGRGGRQGGDANNPQRAAAADDQGGRRRGGPAGFGQEPSPEAEALQKAVESKASADELKTKMAKLREVRKEKEAKLEKVQEELRKVLTVRQEATAVLAGLLK